MRGFLEYMFNIITDLFGGRHKKQGVICVSGRGKIEIPLSFRPKSLDVHFLGHSHSEACCVPHGSDSVIGSIIRIDKHHWGIIVMWHVHADRKVKWIVR